MTIIDHRRPRTAIVGRAIRSELVKLRTLPQVWLTIGGTWVVTIVLATAFVVAGVRGNTGTTSGLDIGLAPIGYSQAGFVILGILAVTSEYIGGQIGTTLTVTPRRPVQRLAQTISVLCFALPIAVIIVGSSVLLAHLSLGDRAGAFDGARTAGAIAGAASYLALTAVLAAGIAGLLRQTLPAVAVLLGYYFIAGPLARDQTPFAKYLPDTAGYTMWFPIGNAGSGALSPAAGWALVCGWTIACTAVSILAFHKRDA